MAKTKVRTLEVVEGELRGAQDREASLTRELREIPDALAEAEREERVEDILHLRRRGEELPVHIWSASRARLRLSVEAQGLELERVDGNIARLAQEAQEAHHKALEARDRASILNGQWHDARDELHQTQASLRKQKGQLAALDERGPNYKMLEELTNQARGAEGPRLLKRL